MRFGDLDPPAGDVPDPSATRAPAGGAVGINGHRYGGGQFLPSTDAPPGTWRVVENGKSRLVRPGTDLIEPGVRAEQPAPYARGIMDLVRVLADVGNDGRMRVKPGMSQRALDHYGTFTPGCRGVVGKRTYTLDELIDLYNAGERWIDASPE